MPRTDTPKPIRSTAAADKPAGKPWWQGAVIYQLYLRSFRDTNGDGIGDLRGVVEKLDYIAALGVDALWLAPFFRSPQVDFGYDISDFRSVDPIFGEMADFDLVMREAHARGLKVMIDFTPCHTSNLHPWHRESRRSREDPKADWYVWGDPKTDGTPPSNWLSSFGGSAWSWEPRRGQYYYHAFLEEQPALNLHNPDALDAMLGEMEFWLDRGVDGIRLDAIQCLLCDPDLRDNPPAPSRGQDVMLGGGPGNPFARQEHPFDRGLPQSMAILEKMRALARRYDDAFLLGEVADVPSIPFCAEATAGDDRLHAAYHFDLINADLDLAFVRDQIEATAAETGAFMPCVLGNQDSTRLMSNWGADAAERGHADAFAKLVVAFVTTQRGGACLYQGDELGLTQAEIAREDLRDPWGIHLYPDFKGRDGCRTPIPWKADAPHAGFGPAKPWLPIPEHHLPRAVDRQDGDPDSVLNAWRRFINWRKKHPALVGGDTRLLRDAPSPLLAYERTCDGETVLVVLNFSDRPFSWPLPEGTWTALDGHGFGGVIRDRAVRLGAYDAGFFGRG